MNPLLLMLLAMPTRGPYLQSATPTSMVVVWRTAAPTTNLVKYGPALDDLSMEVGGTRTATIHEVKLEGLTPGTRYYYDVGDGAVGEDFFFITPPEPGTRMPFRFWLIGDSGTGTAKQGRVRDAMMLEARHRKPDLFLHVGDMAYSDGNATEFQERFYEMYPNVLRNTLMWPAMGNHEAGASDSLLETGPYYEGYVLPTAGESGGLPSGSEAYYAYDHANVHFVVLESHRNEFRETGSAMLNWLEMDLAATDQDFIIVYFHHPPYTKGSHDSDTEIAHIEIRERALPIMEAAGVDLVIGGHSHIYERSFFTFGAYDTPTTTSSGAAIVDGGDGKAHGDGPYHKLGDGQPGGAVFVVAGHGGTNVGQDGDENHVLMYFTEVRNGSLLVDVEGQTMRLRNLRLDGTITDSFAIVKDRDLRLLEPLPEALLSVGSTTTVSWVGAGGSNEVAIELSVDGGETWSLISTASGNSGRFVWTPEVAATDALIRVRDTQDAELVDQVDGPVLIHAQEPNRIVRFGDVWRYWPESLDDRSWTSSTFPDARWEEARAKFGVCGCLPWECGCRTYVAESLLSNTLYLRKDVTIDEIPAAIQLEMLYEVGVVIWVNGVEVVRKDVDDDTFEAFATSDATYARIAMETLTFDTSPFVQGENTIAVMVKKGEESAPNLSFDMEMTLLFEAPVAEDEGCGCRSTHGRAGITIFFLLVLLSLRRGRERRT